MTIAIVVTIDIGSARHFSNLYESGEYIPVGHLDNALVKLSPESKIYQCILLIHAYIFLN